MKQDDISNIKLDIKREMPEYRRLYQLFSWLLEISGGHVTLTSHRSVGFIDTLKYLQNTHVPYVNNNKIMYKLTRKS